MGNLTAIVFFLLVTFFEIKLFLLNFNTKLIVDSLFDAESDYLKTLLNLELNGNGNTIELLKKEGLQEEETCKAGNCSGCTRDPHRGASGET